MRAANLGQLQPSSRATILKTRPQPLLGEVDEKEFFRVVKAGFSAKRKKLRSSLAAGLAISKQDAESLLGEGQHLR